jgi:hypothetical protein
MASATVEQYFATYSKLESLEMTVRDLFLCLGRKSSGESRRMHISLLMDLDVELLVEGFYRSGSCSLSGNCTSNLDNFRPDRDTSGLG